MVFSRKTSDNYDNPKGGFSIKGLVSRLKKKKNSELDDFMVIGIDFGTTYSGAAWATVADFESDQINLISSWPGTGREEGKAPTELFYEYEDVMWGYTIPADADPIKWFKLLLLREDDLAPELRQSEFILRGRKMLRETGKSATDIIADYLGALWKHILETIYKARGQSVIEGLTFHVVITVPAIWKDYARQGMEEAAKKSGILDSRPAGPTTLAFAPEPEAAALASLCENGRSIDTGDVYVICDAGGGTVDLISYKVGDVDPVTLHEAVVGTGGLCGGIFIDEAFETICKNRLGRQWSKLSQTGIKDIMKTEWEYAIKPQFKLGNTMAKEYIVAIPAEAFEGSNLNDETRKPIIKNGRIHFASSDIQKAFTNAFSDIEKLVEGQISKVKEKRQSVTGIILVGGLGSSPYLYEHLKNKYDHKKIDVLQSTGMRPRTAICRGAIYKGFLEGPATVATTVEGDVYNDRRIPNITSPVTVVSTIARTSLGVRFREFFEDGVHLEKDKFWDEDEGVWKAQNQMEWYLKKGDNVSRMEPVRKDFYRTYAKESDFKTFTSTIYQCDDEDPPSRFEGNVKELCDIKCHLNIPYDELEDYRGATGKKLKRLNYDIEMVPSGASNEFSVLYEGMKLGSHNASVEIK